MATVSKKLLFDTMRNESCAYWRVSDNSTIIAENDSEGNIETAIQTLEEVIAEIENPFVDIKICDVTKSVIGKGGNKHTYHLYRVNLASDKSRPKESGSPAMNSQVMQLIEKNNELQRKIDRLEDQKKYDALEQKLNDLQSSDVLSKLLSNPQVLQGISGLFGIRQPVGLAGIEDQYEPIALEPIERQQKIKDAIVRLAQIDPKFDETITLLAEFAETNTSQYFATIEMMKSIL
jgi:hypothetical protein